MQNHPTPRIRHCSMTGCQAEAELYIIRARLDGGSAIKPRAENCGAVCPWVLSGVMPIFAHFAAFQFSLRCLTLVRSEALPEETGSNR